MREALAPLILLRLFLDIVNPRDILIQKGDIEALATLLIPLNLDPKCCRENIYTLISIEGGRGEIFEEILL